jgi:uncharacterized Zn-finger protein
MIPTLLNFPGKTRMSLQAPETIVVTRTRVACDGGEGALGHPRVYLEMGEETFVVCGYCDRRFVLSPEAIAARARGEAESH